MIAAVVSIGFMIIVWFMVNLRIYPHIVASTERYRAADINKIGSRATKDKLPHQVLRVGSREGIAFAYLEDAMASLLMAENVKITDPAEFNL